MFWRKETTIQSEEYKKLALRLFEVEQELEKAKIQLTMVLEEQKTFSSKINALKRIKFDTELESESVKKSDKVYM